MLGWCSWSLRSTCAATCRATSPVDDMAPFSETGSVASASTSSWAGLPAIRLRVKSGGISITTEVLALRRYSLACSADISRWSTFR